MVEIDYSRLNIDYNLNPISCVDSINKEDFMYLFWELNLSKSLVARIMGTTQSCISKYVIKNKIFKTPEMLRQSYNNTIKIKYNVDNVAQSQYSKDKYKNTCLNKYKVDNAWKDKGVQKKRNKTIKDKYGVNNISQNEEIKRKKIETFINNYGYESPLQCPDVMDKIKKSNLGKYGFANPMQVKQFILKAHETKKLNGSYGKSRDEDKIFKLLQQKFNPIERQYYSQLYPYHCDFYIPQLDLYIEYQGFVSHGGHPFNPNNQVDINRLEYMWNKVYDSTKLNKDGSIKFSAYLNFIHTWTVTDPMKRQYVKENNLNWIEFFTLQDFINWYNLIGDTTCLTKQDYLEIIKNNL